MKLLVSGCSITHGAELYNNFMHPENIKKSYSSHLAKKLNVKLINVALSAGSNEYIFHSIVEEIKKNNDIHSVLVMWTSTGRLYWKCKDRHYFFLSNHASSMLNLVDFKQHDTTSNNCYFVADDEQTLDLLIKNHKFFVVNYFDHKKEFEKLQHYKLALSSICKVKNIKLIQLHWENISNIGTWEQEGRHPNEIEHIEIADMIYRNYYENF